MLPMCAVQNSHQQLAVAGEYTESADEEDEAAPLRKHAAAAKSGNGGIAHADTWYISLQ